MVITMHNADANYQANTGDNVVMVVGLNDRAHGRHGCRSSLRTHRLLGRGPSFLPANAPTGTAKPGTGKPTVKRGDTMRRRSERPVWSAISPLPPAAWATLVISGVGQFAGRERTADFQSAPQTVVTSASFEANFC